MPDKLELALPTPPLPPLLQNQIQQRFSSLPLLQVANVPQPIELPRSVSEPGIASASLLQQTSRVPPLQPSFAASSPMLTPEFNIASRTRQHMQQSPQSFSHEEINRAFLRLELNSPAAGSTVRSHSKLQSAQDLIAQAMRHPEPTLCGDRKARNQTLHTLRDSFNSQTLKSAESSDHQREKEILDELIEFPEMIIESDLMLKIADKDGRIGLLAADRQDHHTSHHTIELFISRASHSASLHLLRAAIGQLRKTHDSPVWIKLEGTHFSATQLRECGFKNAPDEDYMVLSGAFARLPQQQQMAASRSLQSVSPELIHAQSQVNDYLVSERQPDIDIYRLDVTLLPQVINSLNQHKPGLNLAYLASIDEVTHAFGNISAGSAQRFLLRSCKAEDVTGTLHHLVLETRRDAQNRLSVIIIDSVAVNAQELGHRELTHHLLETCPNARISFISTGVQRSPFDCIPYSLDIATKCYQRQPLIQRIHQEMLEHNQISGNSGRTYLPEKGIVFVDSYFAGDVLSAPFFKHMSSTRQMAKLLLRYPELDETVVNKKREYLSERQQQRVATHTANVNGEEKKLTYNTSIEHKRLRMLNNIRQS
ncbi:YopJ family acetyltransferase [Erwinia sp. V71]|uniref:YopJ family acetyltransferase n=1 Tax=Erwinia sp. V71 TaxID=3369424 RepID=UPI003F5F998F